MKFFRYVFVSILCALTAQVAQADSDPSNGEQRCDELGANCICAEALNTMSWENIGSYYSDPSDSAINECRMEGQAGSPLAANSRSSTEVKTDARALGSLPSGHEVTAFYGGVNGGNNVFFMGHDDLGGAYTKRAAVRFYVYYTPDYAFAGEGSCTNAKFMQVENMPVDHSAGHIHQYDFMGTPHTFNNGAERMGDCCSNGPPTNVSAFPGTSRNSLRGSWHRFEYVITNRAGGTSPNGIRYQLFWKNITAGTQEVPLLDTMEPCPECGPDNAGLGADDLTPGRRIDKMVLNLYREGGCDGWRGVSHILYAGWDNNLGQRIGSAAEIEGVSGAINSVIVGGSRPLPPSPFSAN